MGSILIRGAKLADPEKICCERLDLLCRNGVIEKIEKIEQMIAIENEILPHFPS